MVAFKGKVVGTDEDGLSTYWTRTLTTDAVGFLSRDLAQTGLFDEENDEAPGEADELARYLDGLMSGKVFMVDVKHKEYNNEVRGDYKIVGPGGLN